MTKSNIVTTEILSVLSDVTSMTDVTKQDSKTLTEHQGKQNTYEILNVLLHMTGIPLNM
jgi:hypothetical protein